VVARAQRAAPLFEAGEDGSPTLRSVPDVTDRATLSDTEPAEHPWAPTTVTATYLAPIDLI
jgi:hypothetical protein